jgi:hypothetical protein
MLGEERQEASESIEKFGELETRTKIIDAVTTLYGPKVLEISPDRTKTAREYLQSIGISTEEYDTIPRISHPHISAIIEDFYEQWERKNNER